MSSNQSAADLSPSAVAALSPVNASNASVCSQDSRSVTTAPGPGGASITTTGSGSLTGSPLQSSPRETNNFGQQVSSAAAISAAKSAAVLATTTTSASSSSVGGTTTTVLPPPWPETSSSSPPTATTGYHNASTTTNTSPTNKQPQQQLPPIPILRNNSQNSAQSSAANTSMPGLTHSISLTASMEGDASNSTSVGATGAASGNTNVVSKSPSATVNAHVGTTGGGGSSNDKNVNSVLLGLEELERQQADAEKKKADLWKAELTMKQQQQQVQRQQQQGGEQGRRSLPPLAPAPSSGPPMFTQPMMFSQQFQQQHMMQQSHPSNNNPNMPPPPPQHYQQQHYQQQQQQFQQHPRTSPQNVPTQIHLSSLNNIDTDDPTALSSIENRSKEEDAATNTSAPSSGNGNGGGGGSMKRIASIEKFQKSAQNAVRRFRSWSQGGGNGGMSSSETGGTTTNNNNGGGGYEGQKSGRSMSLSSPPPSTTTRKPHNFPPTPGLNPTPTKLNLPPHHQRESISNEPYLDEDELTPLIYGYLHKLGRNGHWQKRFFETNGERLTYYKNGKRRKVLATLDLCKVGEIAIDKTDPEECTFTIQVSNRPYYLRAEDKARCNDWVIILNRAREARHGWGNIQLVNPTMDDEEAVGGVAVAGGSRSQAGSDDEFGPCIVISALRPRTQAVNYGGDSGFPPDLLSAGAGGLGGSGEQEQIEVLDGRDSMQLLMQQQQYQMEDDQQQQGDKPVVVKWQKRHSAIHHLSMRMLNWARSITSNADACRRQKDVVVVPAHVMRSMMLQSKAASGIGGEQQIDAEASTAPPPGGVNVSRPSVSGAPKGLQDVVEETPSAEASDSERERKRTESSGDSRSYGMGSSQYV